MSERLRLIYPEDDGDRVIFDSDTASQEQYDPERDHIIAGPGWKLQTPGQVVHEMMRDGYPTCPNCEYIAYTEDNGTRTCLSCSHRWSP